MIDRRQFLLSTSLITLLSKKPIAANVSVNSDPHVVIIGGGWGGLSVAKTLRKLSKSVKITIVEKKNEFQSCPISNWVIGQIKNIEDITFSYNNVAKNNNINFIKGTVEKLDIHKKHLTIDNEILAYDKLVLSTGIEKDYSSIKGIDNNFSLFPAAWEAGSETLKLKNQIKNMEKGEKFVISIPLSPYRCPPGPYERISLIASYFKNHKRNSKIIVLDANQKIVSKGKLFKKAWEDMYSDIIDYRPDNKVVEVNAKNKIISTDFDDFPFSVANIIPPQKAPSLLRNAELIPENKNWAPIYSLDFRSKVNDDVYVIGDSSDQSSVGKIPKSGYIAYSMGKACGFSVYSALNDEIPPSPSMINTCYSLVSNKEAISITAVYKYDKKEEKILPIKGISGLSPERSETIALNAWDWANAIWNDMLT